MSESLDGPRRAAAAGEATSLVVFLHGYGSNGDDLFSLAEPLSRILPQSAFASPNAPERSSLNPFGHHWFALPWIDGASEAEMTAGFEAARAKLGTFLDAELARYGLGGDRLALVGFSQGAMMAMQVGPTREPGPAGIVALSGRLADPERLARERRSQPPVLVIHGDLDDVIPVAALEAAREGLEAAGLAVQTHVSRGVGHGIGEDGLALTAQFLRDQLG